jgi:hypothetical protein
MHMRGVARASFMSGGAMNRASPASEQSVSF